MFGKTLTFMFHNIKIKFNSFFLQIHKVNFVFEFPCITSL